MRGGGEKPMLLFHGSGMANCLSIFSQGLRVKPAGVMHHGSAFGNGIYFANAFQKSRSYCSLNSGTGFMLLCEVSIGKTLEGTSLHHAVRNARIAAAKARLGLAPEVTINEHAELKAAVREIDEEIQQQGGVENLAGTGYDSFHYHSGAAPDPLGDVVHPDGYVVPCGRIVSRSGGGVGSGFGGGASATDEVIVYDTARVRVRYVLELCAPESAAKLKHVKKPNEATEGEQNGSGPGGAGGGIGSQQLQQSEHDSEEEEGEDQEEDDEAEEEMSDDE